MKTSDIKKVIDAGLADIETTQRDVDAIMEYIRNAETRKPARKMPLAVAIAMILMLIGAVAFAAMSFLGVIEHLYSIEEKEQVEEIESWSFEHKMEVVDLLVEAGTDFDQEMLMQIYGDELTEEEKGDLIIEMLQKRFTPSKGNWTVTTFSMLIAEKGFVHQWTHEERAWFEEQIDRPMDEWGSERYVLPTEDDMPEEEALQIAYQYYYDNYGLTRDCFDPNQQYACFKEMVEEDKIIRRHWMIMLNLIGSEYNGQELMLQEVQIYIRNDGSILDACGPCVRTWEDDWFETRYSEGFWTIERLYAFQSEWRPRVQALLDEGEWVSGDLKYLASKEFGLPQDDDLPIETVREIARKAVLATEGWTEELLSLYATKEAYLISTPNQYCIVYTLPETPMNEIEYELYDLNTAGQIPFSIRICIDAQSGNVLEVSQLDQVMTAVEGVGI